MTKDAMSERSDTDVKPLRQPERQRLISEAVAAEGSVRIDQLAERFDISLMTVHRDLDQLQARGILRKSRGAATAASTSQVESSDLYRFPRQQAEKEAIARAALRHVEPGQVLFLDDSTTVLRVARMLGEKTPLTVITNVLTILNDLRDTEDVDLIALGGDYYSWCSAFMGRLTLESIGRMRADLFLMSTSAIVDGEGFHQSSQTVDVKRAMFESAAKRILLVDHTKFERRALHFVLPLSAFDLVIIDESAPAELIDDLRSRGIAIEVARIA